MIAVGSWVEIRAAFWRDGSGEELDTYGNCAGEVLRVNASDDTVDLQVRNGDEVNITIHRLTPIRSQS